MLTNIFEFYYTMNMYPARLKPLSKEELSKGMSSDAVEKYLSLVEQLYQSFFFDVNAEFVPPTKDEQRQMWLARDQIYNSLIKLLFKLDAISDTAYCELHKHICVEYNYIENPSPPPKYIGDSLDDFRLSFEYSLLENDENIDLPNEYLNSRYGYSVCVRSNTARRHITSSDLCVIRFKDITGNRCCSEASYWEVQQLLKTIRQDIQKNTDEQKLLDIIFCQSKTSYFSYIDSLQKTIYGRPKTAAEWYAMKRALETEAGFLIRIEDEIGRIFDTLEKPDDDVGFHTTLFIYKGRTLCHRQDHPIVPATAVVCDKLNSFVELDVEYCPICQRYMLNYTSYEHYRERYGLLIGKLKMISSNSVGGEIEMASESPLKLCGYNVSQLEGLSMETRQFLLAKIIHEGIMTKLDVIHYLEHFINMNGAKKENALALKKWCDDLDFVHKYNMDVQPEVYIRKITKY